MKFGEVRAAIFDMDGVLWREDEPLPGLDALFDWLRESGTPYALATNNSSRTPAAYVAKLARLGVEGVPERAIITASTATAAHLRARYPAGTRVFALGMDGLRVALEDAGFDLLPADAGPETSGPVAVVVAGIDFNLTYARLSAAAQYVRAGADFYGTNGDRTYPGPRGLVPGAGSLLAALVAATDRQPVVIGKPAAPMFEAALALLGAPASAALMVGDRLDTDIAGAKALGLRTALLFTGVTAPGDLVAGGDGPDARWPDVAYEDLPALLRAWAGDDWVRAWVKAARGR
jgi:4-nitrophenyl phosphatase